jgi:hypothetical protein
VREPDAWRKRKGAIASFSGAAARLTESCRQIPYYPVCAKATT